MAVEGVINSTVEGVINSTTELMPQILVELGQLGIWLQAIGVIALLWLIFNIVSLIVNLGRKKELERIRHNIIRVEKKVDNLLRKKK